MMDQILSQTKDQMRKALEVTRTDLGNVRSGRATSSLVENIIISAYGGSTKLKLMEMATISAADAKSLVITPFDPSQISEISKGIQEAHIGLNPVIDGEIVRILIPPLSEERRLEYLKLAKAKLEAGKIMVRQVRQDSMKQIAKISDSGDMNEDQAEIAEKKIQELTDEHIKELDNIGKAKEEELMKI